MFKKGFMIVTALAIVSVLFGSLFCSNLAQASAQTTLYVDPPSIIDPSLTPGSTFDIYVTASDVVDLFLAEFWLNWTTPTLLSTDVGSINTGDVAPFLEQIYSGEVNNDEGWVHVVSGRPIGVKEGLSGTVQIAKITFLVEATGETTLDLFETDLMDSQGGHIAHTVEDGYFSNVGGIGTLVGRGAWPEHNRFSVSGDEDGIQTLYGKVKNIGEGDGYIRVNFTVWDMGGIPTIFIGKHEDPVTGEEIKILPGEIVVISVDLWESRETAWPPGSYSVRATCLYGPDGINWFKDDVKEFGFTIVP